MRLVEMRSGAAAVALGLLLLAGCGKQPAPQPEPEPENPPGYVDAMTASAECQDGSLYVLLGWEPAAGADTYILERNYEALAGIDDAETVSYSDFDVEPGMSYTYVLTAVNANGGSRGEPVTISTPYDACLPTRDSMAASDGNSAMIAADGTLWTWGSNLFGQIGNGVEGAEEGPQQAIALEDLLAVEAGDSFIVTLDTSGQVQAMGDNSCGQLGVSADLLDSRAVGLPVAGLPPIVSIAAGYTHVLAAGVDGSVWSWGCNDLGQLGNGSSDYVSHEPARIPGLESVVAVYAGAASSFAVHEDGSVSAWGSNISGLLGVGDDVDHYEPTDAPGMPEVAKISTSDEYTLVLATDGSVWGIGFSDYLAVEAGDYADRLVPELIDDLTGVIDVSAARRYALAVLEDGSVYGWGDNSGRMITPEGSGFRNYPQAIVGLDDVVRVEASGSHALAMRADGSIMSWGANGSFQLGEVNVTYSEEFLPVDLPADVEQVAAGGHVLALLDDGSVWTWGYGNFGQLGGDTLASDGTPRLVSFPAGTDVVKVGVGGNASMALDSDGNLWSWGYGYYGTLGNGTNVLVLGGPRIVDTVAATFVDFALGDDLALAIDDAGGVWTWGRNNLGQLGLGDTADRWVPVKVPTLAAVHGVAAGANHLLFSLDSGQVWASGSDGLGQLGTDATASGSNTPLQSTVPAPAVTAVAAGQSFSLALHDGGTVSAWGSNGNGQLGHGDYSQANLPQAVPDLDGIVQLTVDQFSVMARDADGNVYAWGQNAYGQLGLGNNYEFTEPQQVSIPGDADYIELGVGAGFVVSDGQLYAVGTNRYGQLGQGRVFLRPEPETVEGIPVGRLE